MATKTCEKCGWVLDIKDPHNRCPICNTKFKTGICRICGQYVTFYRPDRNVCRYCYDTVTRKPDACQKMRQRRRDRYEEWIERLKQIPASYPSLTEAQWMNAVRHFNGCAFCGKDDIASRQYFIPFKYGGRYCDWNIVPACEECSMKINCRKDFNYNYFLKRALIPGLDKTVEYLEEKINGAIEGSTNENK